MKNKYSLKTIDDEHMAKAIGRDMPISTKMAIEICNFIRNKELQEAKAFLAEVKEGKKPVPLKRFNSNVGHKKGKLAAGRFPKKASTHILKLLESAEANAQSKGLNTGSLAISWLVPNRASTPMRYGRQRSRESKATHIEVVVEEIAKKYENKEAKKGKAEEQNKHETAAVKKEEPTIKKENAKTEEPKETKVVANGHFKEPVKEANDKDNKPKIAKISDKR